MQTVTATSVATVTTRRLAGYGTINTLPVKRFLCLPGSPPADWPECARSSLPPRPASGLARARLSPFQDQNGGADHSANKNFRRFEPPAPAACYSRQPIPANQSLPDWSWFRSASPAARRLLWRLIAQQ